MVDRSKFILKPALLQAGQFQLPQPFFAGNVLQPLTTLVALCWTCPSLSASSFYYSTQASRCHLPRAGSLPKPRHLSCRWPPVVPHIQCTEHDEVPVIPVPQSVHTSSHALQHISWFLNLQDPYHLLIQPQSCKFGEKEMMRDCIQALLKSRDAMPTALPLFTAPVPPPQRAVLVVSHNLFLRNAFWLLQVALLVLFRNSF